MSKVKINHCDFEFEIDDLIPSNTIAKYKKFHHFLNIARNMSQFSDLQQYKLGAVLISKGKIISKGYNSTKTHPEQKKYNELRTNINLDKANHYLHAEFDAIRKAKNTSLKNAELYIYHINRNGEQKLARPCAGCMNAIKEHGIKVIHYSTPDGFATEYLDPFKETIVQKSKRPI